MAVCAMECDYECRNDEHGKICIFCGNFIDGKGHKVIMEYKYWCDACDEEDEE